MKRPPYDIILKIVELKSLARTAEYYNYTPSRISQILKAAEKDCGVVLFRRTTGGLVPTAECEALLPVMRSIMNSERYFQEELSIIRQAEAGTVRIGSFSSLSCHWLPQRLKAFGREHPRIRFELKLGDCGQIEEWTQSGEIDVGLTTPPRDEQLEFIPLMEDSYVAVLPREHPLAGAEWVTLDQLNGESFILLEPEDSWEMEERMRRDGFLPHVQYRVKDDYTIMALVESGLGISMLPRLVLTRTPYRIAAVELRPRYLRSTGIVLQKSGYISPTTRQLVDFWLQEAGKEGGRR